ncbi:MAG: patatin-like phospholipase family protein [bacterium]
MQKIGVALGGGGARGLCHIEFIKALDELELKPSIISGTSIGAIIGSFYAAGVSGEEMEELTEKVSLLDIRKMVDLNILSNQGLIKGKGVIDFIDKHLPVKKFEDLPIPLKIIACEFWNRKEYLFQKGEILPAIRASISIPGIFEPVMINNTVLVDGGIINPVPMNAIRKDCDILIAIDVTGTNEPPKKHPKPSILESVTISFQIMESAFVENQIANFKPEIYIKPKLVNVQIFDFHKNRKILESVSDDVKEFKKKLSNLVNKKPAGFMQKFTWKSKKRK